MLRSVRGRKKPRKGKKLRKKKKPNKRNLKKNSDKKSTGKGSKRFSNGIRREIDLKLKQVLGSISELTVNMRNKKKEVILFINSRFKELRE